jgi:hypothetical protein
MPSPLELNPTCEPEKAYHHVPRLCSSLQATDSGIESS